MMDGLARFWRWLAGKPPTPQPAPVTPVTQAGPYGCTHLERVARAVETVYAPAAACCWWDAWAEADPTRRRRMELDVVAEVTG